MKTNTKYRGIISYLIAALFLLYEMAVQTSPSIMTQQLMSDLRIDAFALGLISAGYFVTYSVMQIPVGLILDRFSVRLSLFIATVICALGAILFSYGHSVLTLTLSRLLMGFCSAFAFVSVLAIANHWFSGKVFALLVGLAQLLAAFGAWVGEYPLKSYIINHGSWRSSMLQLGLIGLMLGLLSLMLVQHCNKSSKQSAPKIKESLQTIFSNTQTFWIALYAFCSWTPILIFAELWGVPFTAQRFNMNTENASALITTIWVALAILSPLLGYFSNRFNRRCIFLQITALFGLITSLLLIFMPVSSTAFIIFTLSGIGIAGSGQILTFALVRDINPSTVTATAIAFNNLAVVVGGLLLHPLVGLLLRTYGHPHMVNHAPIYSVQDYQIAFLFIPVCYLTGWISSHWKIKETFCRSVDTNL